MSLAEQSTTEFGLIYGLLITGGVFATLMTILNSWLMRRRQNKLEMERVRMESISKAVPLYNKLALHNAANLAFQLKLPINQQNTEFMFYNICNIMNLRNQIVNQIGDIQLASLTAEQIIGDLGRNIIMQVRDHFGPENSSVMTSLVDNDLPFHQFRDIVLRDFADLRHDFELWIRKPEITEQLEQNCRWYAQLIMYELNYVYMIWYGEPPDLLKLSPDLREHLETTQPNYFQRLRRIDSGSWL